MAKKPPPPQQPPQAPQLVSTMAVSPAGGPSFAQPAPTPDPGTFRVRHPSDSGAYKIIDTEQKLHQIKPLTFPASRGGPEPILTLDQVLGGGNHEATITAAGQIVFHAVGDTGNVSRPAPQSLVADAMTADFTEADPRDVPAFFFHIGDVIYNFGERQYYYDQFYEPYRDYPAPILGVAGNHDGNVAPNTTAMSLAAYLDNFCATDFHTTPEAGGLDRTAQIQPGVYYTFDSPFVRIIALYSGTLEDPGVISSQGGTVPSLPDIQLDYLRAALTRIKSEKYAGAVLFVMHHPPYSSAATHSGSPLMLADLDAACAAVGVWPHAVLSAHVHNYQRFTRTRGGSQIPYIIAGNGGHGIQRISHPGSGATRVPAVMPASSSADMVVQEAYDDTNYGYLRVIVTAAQLRIEYHAAVAGANNKSPDDQVTVDLASGTIAHYQPGGAPPAGAKRPKPARHPKRKPKR